MTYQEAIDTITCALSDGCTQGCNTHLKINCPDKEIFEAVNIAVNAIKFRSRNEGKRNKRKCRRISKEK